MEANALIDTLVLRLTTSTRLLKVAADREGNGTYWQPIVKNEQTLAEAKKWRHENG
jgi:hypothetical protein